MDGPVTVKHFLNSVNSQMAWYNIPDVDNCCFCILDLKTAVALIAVLGIVTSPAVSWAVMRHSYVIRVFCVITTQSNRPDVFDVNLSNVLSFGFAANAGLGPSCLSPQKSNSTIPLVSVVKYLGWVVLLFDIIFLMASMNLLLNVFKSEDKKPAFYFMVAVTLSIFMSFIYAMLYISACVSIGGSFPVFEFIFAFVDMGIYIMWIYFLIVVRSYIRSLGERDTVSARSQLYAYATSFWNRTFGNMYKYLSDQLNWIYTYFYGYISLFDSFSFYFSVWIYFLMVVRSYRKKTG